MNEKENFIVNYLEKKSEFCMSSELINELMGKYSELKNANARKIISNLNKKGKIISSEPVVFANNSYAYAKKDLKPNYKNLYPLFENNKRKLFRAICLIKRQNGMVTYNELAKVTGCTTEKNGNNTELEKIIDELKYFNLIIENEYRGTKIYTYASTMYAEEEFIKKDRQLREENKILMSILNWMVNSNFIIEAKNMLFKGEKNFFKGVEDTKLIWDAIFFCETLGIKEYGKDKKTIGVVDILLDKPYDWLDFEGFQERIEIFINSTKKSKRRILPIIIYDRITNAAIKRIKDSKIICIDINSILGSNYKYIISQFMDLENSEDKSIEKIYEICDSIGQNGNYGNMKGILFEYMMGEVFRKIFNTNGDKIEHSYKIKQYEVDYWIETVTENIFIELKSYKKDKPIRLGDHTQKNTLNWVYKGPYDAFYSRFKSSPNRKCKFCYITTSGFEDDAKVKLEEFNTSKLKPEKLDCYYDRKKLISLLKENKCKKELKIINNFY